MYVENVSQIHCNFCGRLAEKKVIHKERILFVCEKHFSVLENSGEEIHRNRNFPEIKVRNDYKKNGQKLFRSSSIASPNSAHWS